MSRVSGLTERVRLMILRGEIPAGGRVVELHLAERFGIGRGTVREVLRQLEGSGLLVADHEGGMRVVDLDREELVALLQVRAALEALSAGLAAERVREGLLADGALEDLRVLAGSARSAPTRTAAVVADRNFHRAVDALAANRPCHDALDRLWGPLVVCLPGASRAASEVGAREHRELLTAIAAGEADEAAAVARRHVLDSLP